MQNQSNKSLQFLYQNGLGKLLRKLLTHRAFSQLAGWYCNQPLSKRHIAPFIARYGIDMTQAQQPLHSYATFNEFFIRALKPTARPINADPALLIAPADGTVIARQNLTLESMFFVKDAPLTLRALLNDAQLAQEYLGGTLILFRLAPWDYHRFHFPTDCTPERAIHINGVYESVNPIAFCAEVQPLITNERHYIALHTTHFDTLIIIPVGAMCVGKIVHTYIPNKAYKKGDEAGYFCFGGSTVLLLCKKDTVILESEIVHNSREGKEMPIAMGMVIGKKM